VCVVEIYVNGTINRQENKNNKKLHNLKEIKAKREDKRRINNICMFICMYIIYITRSTRED